MQFCLFFTAAADDMSVLCEQLRALQISQDALRLIDCLTIDSPYPAETIAPLLAKDGAIPTTSLMLADDERCLPLDSTPDEDAALRLHAAGIEAQINRQSFLILRGLDDAQFKALRTAMTAAGLLCAPLSPPLPEDAAEGFLNLTPDELAGRGARHRLALPPDCLLAIADYYRTAAQRAPSTAELRLLDEAYRQACADPSAYAPVEFITDDARLHTVYADLMEKRRAVNPDANAPATLEELADVASVYLCSRSHRPLPSVRSALGYPGRTQEQLAALGGSPTTGFTDALGEAELSLAGAPIPHHPPKPGDRVLLLSPTHQSMPRFAGAVAAFSTEPSVAEMLRRSLPFLPHRLLSALGRLLGGSGCGLSLFLDCAPGSPELFRQLSPDTAGILLLCDARGGVAIPAALRAHGIAFTLLAEVQKQPLISSAAHPELLCFPAAMLAPRPALRAVCRSAPASSAPLSSLPPMAALLASLAGKQGRRSLGCEPLSARSLATPPAETTESCNFRCAAIACTPRTDPFGEVRDTVLQLVSRMISAGTTMKQLTLKLTAELPIDTLEQAGRAIAALLGLYAVQIELGLPAEPPVLRMGKQLRLFVGAYASTKSEAAPAHSITAGDGVYLLVPRSTPPHLNGELALLTLSAHELATGRSCVMPTSGLLPAAAAARALLPTGLGLTITADAAILNKPLSFGMLLITSQPPTVGETLTLTLLGGISKLPGVRLEADITHELSHTQLAAALRGDIPTLALPYTAPVTPPPLSLRRAAKPRVLLPYYGNFPAALAQTVSRYGGEPILCALDFSTVANARQSLSVLSDLLDSTQLMLLPDHYVLTEVLICHRRTAEALTQLRARDGLVFASGEAFAALLKLGFFSENGSAIPVNRLPGPRLLGTKLILPSTPWTGENLLEGRTLALVPGNLVIPALAPAVITALLETGRIVTLADGMPDGMPAATALLSPDGRLLGTSTPPTPDMLAHSIAYFK